MHLGLHSAGLKAAPFMGGDLSSLVSKWNPINWPRSSEGLESGGVEFASPAVTGVLFDGVDQYADSPLGLLPESADWKVTAKLFIPVGWTPGGNTYFVGQRSSTSNQVMFGVDSAGTTLRFIVGTNPVTTRSISQGVNYDVTLERVGDVFTLTLSGLSPLTRTSVGHSMSTSKPLELGFVFGNGIYGNVVIRDVKVYDDNDALVADIPGDGPASSNWADLTANGNDFSIYNSPVRAAQLVDGTWANSIDAWRDRGVGGDKRMWLDGVDDYVSFASSMSSDLMALSAWFYVPKDYTGEDTPSSYVVGSNGGSGLNPRVTLGTFSSQATDETLVVAYHPSAAQPYVTYLRDTVTKGWHHVAINWNGSSYDVWLDGVQRTTYPGSVYGHAHKITKDLTRVGTTSTTGPAPEKVATYSAVLSAGDIATLAAGGEVETNRDLYVRGGSPNASDWEDQEGSNDGTPTGSPDYAVPTSTGWRRANDLIGQVDPQIGLDDKGRICPLGTGTEWMQVGYGQEYAQPFVRALVFQQTTDKTAQRVLMDGFDEDHRVYLTASTGDDLLYFLGGASISSGTDLDLVQNVFLIVGNGASSKFCLNGAEIAGGNPGSDAVNGMTLFTNYLGGAFFVDGIFTEVIDIHDPSDIDQCVADLQTYLAWRHGL